jgi:ferredoxin-type protein NapF
MATGIARRDLLRGSLRTPAASIRPPYALAEPHFLAACTRCPDCAAACSQGLVRADPAGYPRLLFSAECTFCGDCLAACATGALDAAKARPWRVKAQIGADCLSLNGTVCRACGDHCGHAAIQFRLMTMGRAEPRIDGAACSGCGACAAVCPNHSLRMTNIDVAAAEGDSRWAS